MTKYLSFDCETSIGKTIHGPTFRDAENDIYTYIYANHPDEVVIEHSSTGMGRTLTPSLGKAIDSAQVIVGHNLSFDLCYIWQTEEVRNFILKGGKIWDTQLAEYLLTGQQHSFASLGELQLKYLGVKEKPNRISYLYKKGVGADKIVQARRRCPKLFALYEIYCVSDGATPLKILKAQLAKAKEMGMTNIIEMYNDYLLSIINMTCTGIKVDIKQTEKTLVEFNLKHLEYLEQAQEILKKVWIDPRLPTFNINSPDHKSAVLFGGSIKVDVKEQAGLYKNGNPKFKKVQQLVSIEGFGVSPKLSTPGKKNGLYSTDDSVMKKIALETKRCDLKEYCTLQKKAMMYKKAAKTYCQAFIDRSVGGYLYPNFNNTLTTTSRLSSSAPNMQNISKRNEFGKILHSLFIAPPGWKCVSVDFAQLEIWVLAWLSKDPLLTQHLLSGVDLHIVRLGYYNEDKTYDELYSLCKGENKEEYWDKQRSAAKTVSYQMAYGAMPKKVVESTGLDLTIVEKIFQKEAEAYEGAASLSIRVRESIESSATFSRASDIPASAKKGKEGSKILGDVELLPIFDKSGNVVYNRQEFRKVGKWRSPTGKQYHFLDTGRVFKGGLSRSFSFTQPKNYPMQGSAADVQGATTAELLTALLTRSDKIKMINEVHDSKWFYVREDVLDPCLAWLKKTIEDVPKIMAKRFGIDIPFNFPVDFEVGDNFGHMSSYSFLTTEETNNVKNTSAV